MCMTSMTLVRGVIAAAMCSTYDAVLATGVSILTRLSTMPSRRSRCRHAFCMRG